uniref:Uncharacterized protein n=1 Tax=Rhipicephalus zambeziensis TaxID=60191 RepID=A0A224YKZ2_9ACAR
MALRTQCHYGHNVSSTKPRCYRPTESGRLQQTRTEGKKTPSWSLPRLRTEHQENKKTGCVYVSSKDEPRGNASPRRKCRPSSSNTRTQSSTHTQSHTGRTPLPPSSEAKEKRRRCY